MDHHLLISPLVITVIDCHLPLLAPLVLDAMAEFNSEVTLIVIGTVIAMAEMEMNLN